MSAPRPVTTLQPKVPTPPPSSPELQAAEIAYREAGFALRRAEAALAKAKKEEGPDSAAAQAAQKQVVEANAAHEKAQRELKEQLGLVSKRSPSPQPPSAPKPPLEKSVRKKNPPQSLEKTYVYLERIEILPREKMRHLEYLKSDEIKKILEEIKKDPKNGAVLMQLQQPPRGETLIRETTLFREPVKRPGKPPEKPGS